MKKHTNSAFRIDNKPSRMVAACLSTSVNWLATDNSCSKKCHRCLVKVYITEEPLGLREVDLYA